MQRRVYLAEPTQTPLGRQLRAPVSVAHMALLDLRERTRGWCQTNQNSLEKRPTPALIRPRKVGATR
ncbi:hypothetical protein MCEMSEM23_01129 [Rhabdaerophilaceae bacterium]